jgi:hypothetical protein
MTHSRKDGRPPFWAIKHLGTWALQELHLMDSTKDKEKPTTCTSTTEPFPSFNRTEADAEAKPRPSPLSFRKVLSSPVLVTPEITAAHLRSRQPSFSTSELKALGSRYVFQDEDERDYTSGPTRIVAMHDGESLRAGLAMTMDLSLAMQSCLLGRRSLKAFEKDFERHKMDLLAKEDDIKGNMRLMSLSLKNIQTISDPETAEEEKRLKKAIRHLERRHASFLKKAEELHDELMWRTREQDAKQKKVDRVLDEAFVECGLLGMNLEEGTPYSAKMPERAGVSKDRGEVNSDDEGEDDDAAGDKIREWLSETEDAALPGAGQGFESEAETLWDDGESDVADMVFSE